MSNLVIAAIFLVGTHLGIASTSLRAQLVAAIGEGPYRILYSLVALAAIGWLVHGYGAAPTVPLWTAGPGLRHLPLLVMPVACLLLVCALTQRNPTALGQAPDPDAAEPARGMLRVTRHPMMWAVALWAIVHILANGDLASLVFFGAFAVLALAGTIAIDARRTEARPPGWGVFLQRTSNLPFQAILERRQKLVLAEIGLARVAAALALYVGLIWLHPVLFGVAVTP
ncbi:MAG: NnrU family protein [Geminicoccaceae bacterium]|nr:NnrU family protein [Geminicoccaceae bacterium]MCX8101910.1 NnrU family protein [Geminicoccaceae bacterium]MDW8369004.1 NnrU family protein [Geminicoccaceae bacterium]